MLEGVGDTAAVGLSSAVVAPVRMLVILNRQQFAQLRTQSGMPALVRTNFAAQRLHRILLFITGSIETTARSSRDQIEPVAQ